MCDFVWPGIQDRDSVQTSHDGARMCWTIVKNAFRHSGSESSDLAACLAAQVQCGLGSTTTMCLQDRHSPETDVSLSFVSSTEHSICRSCSLFCPRVVVSRELVQLQMARHPRWLSNAGFSDEQVSIVLICHTVCLGDFSFCSQHRSGMVYRRHQNICVDSVWPLRK